MKYEYYVFDSILYLNIWSLIGNLYRAAITPLQTRFQNCFVMAEITVSAIT